MHYEDMLSSKIFSKRLQVALSNSKFERLTTWGVFVLQVLVGERFERLIVLRTRLVIVLRDTFYNIGRCVKSVQEQWNDNNNIIQCGENLKFKTILDTS